MPRLDAEVLLCHVAGLDRTNLLIAMRDPVTDDVERGFHRLVERRAGGSPVSYLTGVREFMGVPIQVNESVLVPRPETELLVEWALGLVDTLGASPVRVVDVGAGSGAIAVSVAHLASRPIEMTAVEPSPGAREVMARNGDALLDPSRHSRFWIVDDDLLTRTTGPFDLILANLPYLTPGQIDANPDLDAEPRLALDGGATGIELITRLIAQLPDRTATTFAVGLEIDPLQASSVVTLLGDAFPDADVSVIQDYAGFDRHVVASNIRG